MWRVELKEPKVDHHGIVMQEDDMVMFGDDQDNQKTKEDAIAEATKRLPSDCYITDVRKVDDF